MNIYEKNDIIIDKRSPTGVLPCLYQPQKDGVTMKRFFFLVLLLELSFVKTMPANSQAKWVENPEAKNCSDSISGLMLNSGCNAHKLAQEKLCKYKDKNYLVGEIYLKATTILEDVYFIQLENGDKFSTTKGKGDIGDPVLVIKQSGDYYVEKFQPKWIAALPGVNLSDRKINSVISRYLEKGETIDSFCPTVSK